jgi:predicted NAD/FAD-binding protein
MCADMSNPSESLQVAIVGAGIAIAGLTAALALI